MSLEAVRDTKVMRAQAHPVRLRMLSLMTGAPFSAAELARELNITHALASYHLRRLADAELVSLVETRTTNHATELRYRYIPGGPADHDASGDLLSMVDGMASEARRRAADAVPGAPRTLIDAELWLDPATWEAARQTLRDVGLQVHRNARPPHEPGSVRIHLSLLALSLIDERP